MFNLFENKEKLIAILFFFLIFGTGFSQNNLDYYLKVARNNNPVVKESLANVEKSAIQESIIKAETKSPKVFASGDVNYSPLIPNKNDPKAVGYDVAISNGSLYSALLNVEQSIFNKANFETLINQTKTQSETSANRAKLSIHQLEKDVTDQYILSYQSLNQIAFVKQLYEQLEQQKKTIIAFAKKGFYNRSDIILIDIEILNQATELKNLTAIYNRNIFKLNDLCGISGNADSLLEAPNIVWKHTEGQSQFMKQFVLDSLNEVNNLKVSNLKYRPQFKIYGNTGLNAIETASIYRKFGAGIGVSMLIPIYDGHQKKQTQLQSNINLQVIDNYRKNFEIQKTNRQEANMNDLNLLNQKVGMIHKQLDNYQNLLAVYKSQLQVGELDIVNYMNTIKFYIQTQNSLTISETNKLLIINENNYYNW